MVRNICESKESHLRWKCLTRLYHSQGHPFDKPLSEWRDSVLPEDLEKTHAFFVDGINAGHDSEYTEFRFRFVHFPIP